MSIRDRLNKIREAKESGYSGDYTKLFRDGGEPPPYQWKQEPATINPNASLSYNMEPREQVYEPQVPYRYQETQWDSRNPAQKGEEGLGYPAIDPIVDAPGILYGVGKLLGKSVQRITTSDVEKFITNRKLGAKLTDDILKNSQYSPVNIESISKNLAKRNKEISDKLLQEYGDLYNPINIGEFGSPNRNAEFINKLDEAEYLIKKAHNTEKDGIISKKLADQLLGRKSVDPYIQPFSKQQLQQLSKPNNIRYTPKQYGTYNFIHDQHYGASPLLNTINALGGYINQKGLGGYSDTAKDLSSLYERNNAKFNVVNHSQSTTKYLDKTDWSESVPYVQKFVQGGEIPPYTSQQDNTTVNTPIVKQLPTGKFPGYMDWFVPYINYTNIQDNRTISPLTGGPIDHNHEMKGGKKNLDAINDILAESHKRNYPPYVANLMLGIGLVESSLAGKDGQYNPLGEQNTYIGMMREDLIRKENIRRAFNTFEDKLKFTHNDTVAALNKYNGRKIDAGNSEYVKKVYDYKRNIVEQDKGLQKLNNNTYKHGRQK